MSNEEKNSNASIALIQQQMKSISESLVPIIATFNSFKPVLDSINEINKQFSLSIRENVSIPMNAIVKEFNEVNIKIIKEANNSIYQTISKTLNSINKIYPNVNEYDNDIESSEITESLNIISNLIDENICVEGDSQTTSQTKNELTSIQTSVPSDKIDWMQYINLVLAIIGLIYAIMSYHKPSNDEELLKVLNQINSKMEQRLKVPE